MYRNHFKIFPFIFKTKAIYYFPNLIKQSFHYIKIIIYIQPLQNPCKNLLQYLENNLQGYNQLNLFFLKEILLLGSNKDTSEFMIECGKGYYVRSLARDIALKLGTFGHVVELKRIKVGNFENKTSILLDDLLKIGQSEFEFNYIHSSISMLDDILAYEIKEKTDLIDLSLGKAIFINHKLINKPLNSDKKELVFLSYRGSVVSFGKLSEDLFKPNKVLI